jgi:hypothetical protein
MKKLLLFLIVSLALSSVGFTWQKDNPVSVARMEVNLWPDYDRSAVLIIYRIQLSSETKLPVQFSIRIPQEAGYPYKVATRDMDGLLYNLEYSLVPEGSWNRVILTTSSDELHIEYYDPRIETTDTEKSFEYSWIGDYPVETMEIKVQKPRFSENFTISPPFGFGVLNPDDGLYYFSRLVGKVGTGITYNVDLAYTKTSIEFSASNLPVQAATAIEPSTRFGNSLARVINPILDNKSLLTAGSLLLGGMLLAFIVSFFGGQLKIKLPQKLNKRNSNNKSEDGRNGPEAYCPHCGKKTKPGDRYCRGCGNSI